MQTRLISIEEEPITVAAAQVATRITAAAAINELQSLLTAAREFAEHETGRSVARTTRESTLDAFPDAGGAIALPHPPLLTVASFTYKDAAGVTQALAVDTGYQLDVKSEPGRLLPPVGGTWPSTQAAANAVTIRYTAGYTAATCPEAIKRWVYLQVRALYDQPVESARQGYMRSPADALLDRYRIGGL